MLVSVRCPYRDCGQRYRVEDSQIGRSSVCRHCGRPFAIGEVAHETAIFTEKAETHDSSKPAADPAGPSPVPRALPIDQGSPGQIGRFKIVGQVGAGAFGTVYRAYDPILDREVALKVPRLTALENPALKTRFLREAKTAAQLRHPHIVPIYDAGSEGESYYIASAFIQGRTLAAVIEANRPDMRAGAAIVRDLAGALDYAHRTGVIHRDVKPGNIMIDDHGQALLTDFGLARLERAEEKLTQEGSVMGTPAYMAPEQADASFGKVGPASDQYSLGVVLYELLCGETPFSGPPAVLIFNAVHQTPESPRTKNRGVSRDLETICLKAMSKRPQDRYPDCEAMAEDLRRWLADEPIRARPMGPAERVIKWAGRNPVVASLVTAVALVTLVGLVAVTSQWQRAESHRRQAEANRGLAEKNSKEADSQRTRALANAETARRQQQRAENALLQVQATLKQVKQQKEAAEEQKKQADQARQAAHTAQTAAEQASRVADRARKEALDNLEEAKRQRTKAEEGERIARHNLYVAEMNLAMQALEAGNTEHLAELLQRHIPKSAQDEDVRGFEWYYLAGQIAFGGLPKSESAATVLKHGGAVYAVGVSADGATVLSVGDGGESKAWDVKTSLFRGVFEPPKGFAQQKSVPWCMPFSWTQGMGGAVSTTRGNVRAISTSSALAVSGAIAFSPECAMLAVPTFEHQREETRAVAVGKTQDSTTSTPFANRLPDQVANAYLARVVLWSGDEQKQIAVLEDCTAPIAFSGDGKTLAAVRVERPDAVDLMTRGQITRDFQRREQEGKVPKDSTAEDFIPKRPDVFYVVGVALYDVKSGKILSRLSYSPAEQNGFGRGAWVSSIFFSPDGDSLVSVERGWHPRYLGSPGRVGEAADRRDRGAGLIDRMVLWNARTGEKRRVLPVVSENLVFTPKGDRFVACSEGGAASIWDLKSGTSEPLGTLQGDCADISPDGTALAVWQGLASSVKEEKKPRLKKDEVRSRAKAQLALESNKAIQIWDLEHKRVRVTLAGHRYAVRAGAFAPDNKTFATASEDGTIRLWDTLTGTEKLTLKGHTAGVLCLAFSRDGGLLVSGSRDGTARLWRGPTGQALEKSPTWKKN